MVRHVLVQVLFLFFVITASAGVAPYFVVTNEKFDSVDMENKSKALFLSEVSPALGLLVNFTFKNHQFVVGTEQQYIKILPNETEKRLSESEYQTTSYYINYHHKFRLLRLGAEIHLNQNPFFIQDPNDFTLINTYITPITEIRIGFDNKNDRIYGMTAKYVGSEMEKYQKGWFTYSAKYIYTLPQKEELFTVSSSNGFKAGLGFGNGKLLSEIFFKLIQFQTEFENQKHSTLGFQFNYWL